MSKLFKKLFSGEMSTDEEDEYITDAGQELDQELEAAGGSRYDNMDVSEEDDGVARGDDEDMDGELSLDMYDRGDDYVVVSTIAGVKPDDVDITVVDNTLLIKGERKQQEKRGVGEYIYQECYWGSFSRSVDLPSEVDVDKTEAFIKDGVLTVVLPKTSVAKRKKVKVKSE